MANRTTCVGGRRLVAYPGPPGDRTDWNLDPQLPIQASVEVAMPVKELWQIFRNVRNWPRWNGCMFVAGVSGGTLVEGQTLAWAFNPIRPAYLYRLPAFARLAEVVPERRVTWEVIALPGFYARHTYWMEPIDEEHCRFGSWEVAQGPVYRLLRGFWLAHFRYVCAESVAGASRLAAPR